MTEKEANHNSIRGKKSRAAGARFELKVRSDLEEQGWVLDKWTNNVDIEEGIIIKAKRKYNPYLRALSIGTGFPDFIGIKPSKKHKTCYEIMGVEVKSNGWLDKEEKEKCKILLNQKVFSNILIARKSKERGKIQYDDFKEKYNKT